jgi:NAD(P)-dependent dehydrogenase (short-subunit alcohol dehydrogenase family)
VKLQGKVALVTGASRGIGRGIAEVFADEGANVAVNYIDPADRPEDVARMICSKGRQAITVKADVSVRVEVEAMIGDVWNQLGPIDVLVNTPGSKPLCPSSISPTISGPGSST